LLRQVAVRDRGRHLRDVPYLAGQIARHRVDAVGQVLPRARHALHLGLAAELAFRADLANHARDLGGERAELVHHAVDDHGGAEELTFQAPAVRLAARRLLAIDLGDRVEAPAPP